jgi:hypothetical protein
VRSSARIWDFSPIASTADKACEPTKTGQIQKNGEQNPETDTVPFMDGGACSNFEELPPVVLPDRGPL